MSHDVMISEGFILNLSTCISRLANDIQSPLLVIFLVLSILGSYSLGAIGLLGRL